MRHIPPNEEGFFLLLSFLFSFFFSFSFANIGSFRSTLLGSFSNYLVTKSSVPVMVARNRLKKKSKYQPPPFKQVNNLANPQARSLEMARID